MVSNPKICHTSREWKVKRWNFYPHSTAECPTRCITWFSSLYHLRKELYCWTAQVPPSHSDKDAEIWKLSTELKCKRIRKKNKILHKAATKEQYFLRILKNEMLFSQISSLKHEKNYILRVKYMLYMITCRYM